MTTQFGICLTSLFSTFVLELCAYRLSTAYLAKRGITMDVGHTPGGYNGVDSTHGSHAIGHHDPRRNIGTIPAVQTDIPAGRIEMGKVFEESSSNIAYVNASEGTPAYAQTVGVAILEFGIAFHSVSGTASITTMRLNLRSTDHYWTHARSLDTQ